MLAWQVLSSKADRVVMVDADIAFEADDLLRLLECEEDVVGGVYPKKEDTFVAVLEPCLNPARRETSTVLEVARIGTGFLSISRNALERMVAAYPETAYRPHGGVANGKIVHALFDTAIVDGRYLSEDWLFCDRWRAIGGKVYCHKQVHVGHVGSKIYRESGT